VKYGNIGYVQDFPDGEKAPPAALAGRRVIGQEIKKENPKGGVGKVLVEKIFRRQYQHDQPYEIAKSGGDYEKGYVEQMPRKTKRVSYMPPSYQEVGEMSGGIESKQRDGW